MQLGIFAKTFERDELEDVFAAVHGHDLDAVQYNMVCAGLTSMPDAIDPALADRIHQAASQHQVTIAAVSGTYNMIHPDPAVRAVGLSRLRVLAAACAAMGTGVITLCTGTRDADDMWRWHPDNATPQAWDDLLRSMADALQVAEDAGVTLAFEPERANVVYTAQRGRDLIAAMGSSHLRVILDPANIIMPGEPAAMERTVDEAFDLLGEHIIIAHAKDRAADDSFAVAGRGILNYDHYVRGLQRLGFDGPLVLHGLDEAEVPAALQFLHDTLAEI